MSAEALNQLHWAVNSMKASADRQERVAQLLISDSQPFADARKSNSRLAWMAPVAWASSRSICSRRSKAMCTSASSRDCSPLTTARAVWTTSQRLAYGWPVIVSAVSRTKGCMGSKHSIIVQLYEEALHLHEYHDCAMFDYHGYQTCRNHRTHAGAKPTHRAGQWCCVHMQKTDLPQLT